MMVHKMAAPARSRFTGAHLGLLVAIASWAMLFATFILSFMLHRARVPVWPPIGTEAIPPLLPTLATGLLIASSFFIHLAYRQLVNSELMGFRRFWGIGTLLGVMFLILQVGTWNHLYRIGISLKSSLFASIFYTLTGIHALHVIGGLSALAWVYFRAGRYTPVKSITPQLSAWFWHFMDVVWVIMFLLLVVL
jgi:cytochrome c oxidase subunit 3